MQTLEELMDSLPSDIVKDGKIYWLSITKELMGKWSGGYSYCDDSIAVFMGEESLSSLASKLLSAIKDIPELTLEERINKIPQYITEKGIMTKFSMRKMTSGGYEGGYIAPNNTLGVKGFYCVAQNLPSLVSQIERHIIDVSKRQD